MILGVFCLVVAFAIILGYLIHSIIPKNIFFEGESKLECITTYLLTGILTQICIIANSMTFFNTVFVIPIIGLFVYILAQILNKQFRTQFEIPDWNILGFVLLFLLSTLIFYTHRFFFIDLDDFVFYAKLSNSIFFTGIEKSETLYNSYISVSKGVGFYHFGELWLTAAYSKLFHLEAFEVYCNIILPLFHLIIVLTFSSILNSFKIHGYFNMIWCIAILYGSIFLVYPILTPEKGHYTFWYYSLPDVTSLKSLITVPFILLLYSAVYLDKMKSSVILTIGMSILNILFIPLVFLTLFYFILIRIRLIKAWLFRKKYSFFWVSLFFFAVLVLLLIVLLPSMKQGPIFQRYIFSPAYYWNNRILFINYFVDYFSRSWVLFPFTIIGILYFRNASNTFRKILIFHIYVITCLCFLITLFKDVQNITQILSLFLQGAGMALTLFMFLEMKTLHLFRFILSGVIIISFLNIYSTTTIKQQFSLNDKAAISFWTKVFANKNLAFVSGHTWSNFKYNAEILTLPVFRNDNVNLPFDVTPCLDSDKDFTSYIINNRDYPLKSRFQMGKFLRQKKVKYLLVSKSRLNELQEFHLKIKKCGLIGDFCVFSL